MSIFLYIDLLFYLRAEAILMIVFYLGAVAILTVFYLGA